MGMARQGSAPEVQYGTTRTPFLSVALFGCAGVASDQIGGEIEPVRLFERTVRTKLGNNNLFSVCCCVVVVGVRAYGSSRLEPSGRN